LSANASTVFINFRQKVDLTKYI